MNDSGFISETGIKCTAHYRNAKSRSDLQELLTSWNTLFVEDKSWIAKHRGHLLQLAEYCRDYCESDYAMDSVEKIAGFLKWFVKEHSEQKREVTLFNLVRSDYIPVIQRVALWQGYYDYSHDLLKRGPVYIVYRQLLFQKANAERSQVVDYAASSRNRAKRLHPEESKRAADAIYEHKLSNDPKVVMRTYLEHFLLMSNGRRGEDVRSIKLSQLQLSLLPAVGPQRCYAIGASLRDVKERIVNMETLIGWVRARDRMECPVGALAAYLVWLMDIQGVPILQTMYSDICDLKRTGDGEGYDPQWRKMFLVFGKDIYSGVSSSTHNSDITRMLDAGDILGKTAKTHLGRNTVLCNETESGVNHTDVRGHMGLEHTTCTDVYLRGSYWTRPMLAAVGWKELDAFHCWWEGDDSLIPNVLKQMVFRGLDSLQRLVEEVNAEYSVDYSAVELCKVLVYLRRVFLEDSVVKRETLIGFPPYSHSVFSTGLWTVYSDAEKRRVEERASAFASDSACATSGTSTTKMEIMIGESMRRQEETLAKWMESFREKKITNSSPELSRVLVCPLPVFPEQVLDMKTFYKVWVDRDRGLLQAHLQQNGNRIAWGKVLHKSEAKTQAVRYQRYQDWLGYLDSLEGEGVANKAIQIMERFGEQRGCNHNTIVKQLFYYGVREDVAGCSREVRRLGNELITTLVSKDLPRPSEKKIQKRKG
jgi:hypothetical protein